MTKKSPRILFAVVLISTAAALAVGCNDSETSTPLSEPQNVKLVIYQEYEDKSTNYVLKWDGVENALDYEINIGKNTIVITETTIDITEYVTAGEEFTATIKASSASWRYTDSTAEFTATAEIVTPSLTYTLTDDGTYEVYRPNENDYRRT